MAEINSEELAAKARKTLGTMLDYLGLNAEELKAEVKDNQLAVKIKSTEPGRIIGRKGQTLDSLQLLLNRTIHDISLAFSICSIAGRIKDHTEAASMIPDANPKMIF